MSRLPSYFRDRYLAADNVGVRLSGLPADLGHFLDDVAPAGEPLSMRGTVLHYMNPKALADSVGHVSTSIVPAVLDELLRRSNHGAQPPAQRSYFVDMFAVLALDTTPTALVSPASVARRLLVDALYDHFEDLSLTLGDGETRGLDEEVDAIVTECPPDLALFEVTFRFARRSEPRGARLLGYLFDKRPGSLTPAPWPKLVRL